MSECIHKEVVTFRTEAGEPVPLWACSKCKTRFEPIGPWMEREKSLQARIEALEAAATDVVECGVDAMAYDRRQVLDALAALLEATTDRRAG